MEQCTPIPQGEAYSQADCILPALHWRLLDGDERLVVPLVIEQVVSQPLHGVVEGADSQGQAGEDQQLPHADSDVSHRTD